MMWSLSAFKNFKGTYHGLVFPEVESQDIHGHVQCRQWVQKSAPVLWFTNILSSNNSQMLSKIEPTVLMLFSESQAPQIPL